MEKQQAAGLAVMLLPDYEFRQLDGHNPLDTLIFDGFRKQLFKLGLVAENPSYLFTPARYSNEVAIRVRAQQIAKDGNIAIDMLVQSENEAVNEYAVAPAFDLDDATFYSGITNEAFNALLAIATRMTARYN